MTCHDILQAYRPFSDRVELPLHLCIFLSSSLSISRSAIFRFYTITQCNSWLSNRSFCLQLYTPYISSPSPRHFSSSHHITSIPCQPTTSNYSCDRLNSIQPNFSILHLCCCVPTPMDPLLVGESDVPACGPPASFSVHLAIRAVTPAGSVHKSRGDNVMGMWVQLER